MAQEQDYAIIKTGGKQYRVSEGQKLETETLGEAAGNSIELTEVLLVKSGDSIKVGTPLVEGAKVTAKVIGDKKAAKVYPFFKRRRKGSKKKRGHRQILTVLEIEKIQA